MMIMPQQQGLIYWPPFILKQARALSCIKYKQTWLIESRETAAAAAATQILNELCSNVIAF